MPRLTGLGDRRSRPHIPGTITHFRSSIAEPEHQYLDPTEGDRAAFVFGGSDPAIWTREVKHGVSPEPLDPDVFSVFPHYNERSRQ